MKIKTKKTMNLPQLIEWAWDNNVKGRMFITESDYCVGFDRHGFIYFNSINSMPLDQTFTVEVEEEVKEDTVIPEMLLVFNNGVTHLIENRKLNYLDTSCLKSAYIMNDDLRLILIWRDGKLVE